jgi:hypothetical protein
MPAVVGVALQGSQQQKKTNRHKMFWVKSCTVPSRCMHSVQQPRHHRPGADVTMYNSSAHEQKTCCIGSTLQQQQQQVCAVAVPAPAARPHPQAPAQARTPTLHTGTTTPRHTTPTMPVRLLHHRCNNRRRGGACGVPGGIIVTHTSAPSLDLRRCQV